MSVTFSSLIRRFWWLVLLCATVGAAAGFAYNASRPVSYVSRTTLSVIPTASERQGGAVSDLAFAQARALSYQDVATSPAMAQAAATTLERPGEADDLRLRIRVTIPAESSDLQIEARGTSPQDSLDLISTWSSTLRARSQLVERRNASVNGPTVALTTLSSPVVGTPQRSGPVVPVVLGGSAGLALSLLMAHLLGRRRSTRNRAVGAASSTGASGDVA